MTITVEGLDHKFEKGTLTSIELAIWWVQDTGLQKDAMKELADLRRTIEEANLVICKGVQLMPLEQLNKWRGVRAWQEEHDCVSANNAHTVYDDGGRA